MDRFTGLECPVPLFIFLVLVLFIC